MKQQGNEWADEVAKKALKKGQWEEDSPIDQEWVLRVKTSGKVLHWLALPKLIHEKRKKERSTRLEQPANPILSRFGQGRRSQEARRNRTILFRQAMKAYSEIHFMSVQYAANKIITREFMERQRLQKLKGTSITEDCCPMCSTVAGQEKIQTKEHLFSGECIITKQVVDRMKDNIEKEMLKWKLPEKTRGKYGK